MTREEFIKALKDKGYFYEIEGDKLVVTHNGYVYLDSLETIPSGVEFNNSGSVGLRSLNSLPSGVEFKNSGDVYLDSLETIPSDVEFKNSGDVYLWSLNSLPSDVEFNNGGSVDLYSLIGGWFSEWEGNIEGIRNRTLLNIMIKRDVFL